MSTRAEIVTQDVNELTPKEIIEESRNADVHV